MNQEEQLQFEMSLVHQEMRDIEVHLAAAKEDVARVRHNTDTVADLVRDCEGALKTVLAADIVSIEEYKDATAILEASRAQLEGARIAIAKKDTAVAKCEEALKKAKARYDELHSKLRNVPVATVTRLFPREEAC